jgi:putative transposase
VAGLQTPPRAPTANVIAERIVRTIRIECLDHLIVIDERHLRAVLAEFADYYNRDRPHRSLGLQKSPSWQGASPCPSGVAAQSWAACTTSTLGRLEIG